VNAHLLDTDITLKEVKRATNSLLLDKAPGPDQIPYEFFKCFKKQVILKLCEALNEMFHKGEAPIE
jgi:hypothetical protein